MRSVYQTAIIMLAAVIAGLCGCTTVATQRAEAVQKGLDLCESMGKQVRATVGRETVVEFACVGPGEDGYVTPP